MKWEKCMKPKIAIISSAHFCDYIKWMITYYHLNLEEHCTLHYYEYDQISGLPDVYEQIFDEYDGFCVTGNTSRLVIQMQCPDKKKPIRSISAKSAEYYKEFFFLINEHRDLSLERVALDSYYWMKERGPSNIPEWIDEDRRLADIQKDVVENIPLERIQQAERAIVTGAKKAWEEGSIDLVVCRFSSAFPALQREGIPAAFVYPTSDTVVGALDALFRDIEEKRRKEEYPAVLFLASEQNEDGVESGISMDNLILQKCLLEFDREQMAGFVVNQARSGYEIYTAGKVVRKITDEYEKDGLGEYIFQKSGIQAWIGYGIGKTLVMARQHAAEAFEAAQKEKKSFLMKEDEVLTGPLGSGKKMRFAVEAPALVQEAAVRTGLSVSTIQRICAVAGWLEKDEMTAQDLASGLQVTVANANRFLNALLIGGYATITQKKKSGQRGRPSRIYKILLDKIGA